MTYPVDDHDDELTGSIVEILDEEIDPDFARPLTYIELIYPGTLKHRRFMVTLVHDHDIDERVTYEVYHVTVGIPSYERILYIPSI